MARTPTPTQQAILDRLEPEAAASYIAAELNLPEAIAASQAMTSKVQSTQEYDARVIELSQLDSVTYDALPTGIKDRYGPQENPV